MINAYQAVGPPPEERRPSLVPNIEPLANIFLNPAFGPALSGIASVLTAMKAQTTMSNGTFSAVDQALYSDLEAAVRNAVRLVITPFPNDLACGNTAIASLMGAVYTARGTAATHIITAHQQPGKPPYDPSSDLKKIGRAHV